MRNTLLIRVGQDPAAGCHWLPLNNEGQATGVVRSGSLEEAAVEAQGLRVIALIPGVDCLLTTVKIPGRSNRQKLLRAIPYALEEQLSDEVEDLHFAVGEVMPGGDYPVAIVAMRCMNAYTEAFRDARLDVARMLPDTLAIPCTDADTCIVIEGELALVRTGASSGYVIDADNLEVFIKTGQSDDAETDTPAVVRMFISAGSMAPELSVENTEVESYNGDVLALLAQGVNSDSIDLLQGSYSRTQEWGRLWRPWRATAALLVGGFLLSNVVMGVDYYRLSKEQDSLATRIEAIYRQAFPGAKRVVNPRVQMQQRLDKLQRSQGAGGQFLMLLARAGDVLRKASDIEISGASYRAGRLDVDLTAASLQVLDNLKQTLTARGLTVEIQSATTETGKRVKSRLRIQGRPA
ncbi:MAG: type II secretion system protein GspL [Thiohalobacterales bacterium]